MCWRKIGRFLGILVSSGFLIMVTFWGTSLRKPKLVQPKVAPAPEDESVPTNNKMMNPEAEGLEDEELTIETIAETFKAPIKRDLGSFINLQPVIDQWVQAYSFGEAGIEIYDMDYHQVAASYHANVQMAPRSLYKLFYAYDGYAQIDTGRDDPNQIYLNDMTLEYCLNIMISQSNNPCAEKMLEGDPPRLERVGQLIQRLGLTSTQSDGLLTSAHDISTLLQYYYVHPEWSASSWQKFRRSALQQGFTFRKGLPAGFATATVYNKTGYGYGATGNVYNDAAMVEFPMGNGRVRRYVVVVMTRNPASYTILTKLGEMLERAILYI